MTPLNRQSTPVRPRRIVLVEDNPTMSCGLTEWIHCQEDLRVCGIAEDYASAIELMETLKPDLIISDINLKGRDGLALVKEIKARCPRQRVIMLSMQEESLYAPRALRAGASGYVMKDRASETLLTAIHKVLEGDIYLSEPMGKKMLQGLFGRASAPDLEPLKTLSDRELEVYRLIGQIKSTREIAAELHLSIKTVDCHRANLKKKLNLANGRELLRHAICSLREEVRVNDGPAAAVSNSADSWPVEIGYLPNRKSSARSEGLE